MMDPKMTMKVPSHRFANLQKKASRPNSGLEYFGRLAQVGHQKSSRLPSLLHEPSRYIRLGFAIDQGRAWITNGFAR